MDRTQTASGAAGRPFRRASDPPRRVPGMLGLYLAFWHYAAGQRGRVMLSSSLLVGSELVKLAIPWLAAQAINTIQRGGPDALSRAGLLVLAVLGTAVLSWALHGPGRIIERGVAMHIRRRIADGLYAKLGRLPLPWHEQHHTGETLQRIHKTTSALSDFAQNQFLYLQNIVRLVGPIIALTALAPQVGMIAVAGYGVVGLVVMRFDRVLIRLANEENEADRRYNASLIEFIGNIQSVLALRLQAATRVLLGQRMEKVMQPIGRSIVVIEYKWCAVDLLSLSLTWGLVAAYAMGLGAVAAAGAGAVLLGNVFMVYQYAGQAGSVIGSLAANFQQFARYRADYGSADLIMHAPDAPSTGTGMPVDWRTLELQGVVFRHARTHHADRPGLSLDRLQIRRGEKIALVGPSGAGKSTLMRVLAGLYEADEGSVRVDDVALPSVRSLGRTATFIPQDTEVFEASVRDNLTLGVDHPVDRIERATRVSALDAVLATLPQGLDTQIVERGSNLSGGQKQRLALARGLLAASSSTLVMLDEPTSALDPVTESQVFERLHDDFPEATVIASVHRMSVLGHFDRVVLMQGGRIVDAGSVDELRARSELFQRMQRGGETAAGNARAASARAGAPNATAVGRRDDRADALARVAADTTSQVVADDTAEHQRVAC